MLSLPRLLRLNSKTDCKKYFPNSGDSQAEHRHTLRKLLFWCSSWQEFGRQRDHMCFGPTDDMIPPLAFIQARREDRKPVRADVKNDEELDYAGVPCDLAPPESWKRCDEIMAEEADRVRHAAIAASAPPAVPAVLALVPAEAEAEAPARGRGRGAGRGRRARGRGAAVSGEGRGRAVARGRGRGRARAGDIAGASAEVPAPAAEVPVPDRRSSCSDSDSSSSTSSDSPARSASS